MNLTTAIEYLSHKQGLLRIPTYGSFFLLILCGPGPTPPKERAIFRDRAPRVLVGNIHWSDRHTPESEKVTAAVIAGQLEQVISFIDSRDLRGLENLVSRQKGLWIDLKTHKSFAELQKEIRRSDGYLQLFYYDTEKLRVHTGDPDRLSVRDVLRHTSTLRADFYMEPGAHECELKLYLIDSPALNYQLNNPVFILEGDTWKIYRLP